MIRKSDSQHCKIIEIVSCFNFVIFLVFLAHAFNYFLLLCSMARCKHSWSLSLQLLENISKINFLWGASIVLYAKFTINYLVAQYFTTFISNIYYLDPSQGKWLLNNRMHYFYTSNLLDMLVFVLHSIFFILVLQIE